MSIEHSRSAVVLALVASYLVYVDGTIVNLALGQLAQDLDASRPELEWAVNAYTLAFAAGILGGGVITDVLGAKRAFVAGLLVFTAASGMCAAAASMLVLDLARLVQGVGAALLLPSALVLATSTTTDESARHRLVGWWAAAGGAGMASGPLLGGGLVSLFGWRAVFAVNVVVGVPSLVWSLRSMPGLARRPRRLDLAGLAAATLLIGGLVFALVEAYARGWGSPLVLSAAALCLAGLVGLVRAERSATAPLLPLGVWSDRSFVGATVQGGLFNFTFYGLLFAMSLLLQQGRGLDAMTSGLLFLPLTGLITVGTLCSAPLASRIGRRAVLATGHAALAVTLLTVAWASAATSLWYLVVALLPVGLSAGVLVPALTSQAISAVTPDLHGAASAAFNAARQVGGAVGVATFGPLLGATDAVGGGFARCVAVGAGAVLVGLLVTAVRPHPTAVAADNQLGASAVSDAAGASPSA